MQLLATIDANEFSNVLAGVLPHASDDDTRPHLGMLCLDVGDGQVAVSATDGHRLCTHRMPGTTNAARRVKLTRRHAVHLLGILDYVPDGAIMEIHVGEGMPVGSVPARIEVRCAHLTMAVEESSESFPPIDKVMPVDEPKAITFLNATYVREALAAFNPGEPVKIELRGELDPVRFSNADGLALVMPLRSPF